MKIINSVVVFVILVSGSQFSHGVKLKCKFEDEYYFGAGYLYSCVVSSLVNSHNNLNIEGYSGVHERNKNDADVKGILIQGTNTKYIPMNLGSLFNLTALNMMSTQLVEIKAEDFHGMQDLQYLNIHFNNLSSVPLDVFATLTKLRIIYLSYNEIEELPNGIFGNNLELEKILLNDNKIKYLGTEIFHDLKKLNYVHLERNICVNKGYYGATGINQLKTDIQLKCKNPNEVPATTTRTTSTTQTPTRTTTTQNPMAEKLIEMQEKITKLEKELREAKEQQQTNEEALKKDLFESKQMVERIPKLERETYDLNKNIFEIKEQRRIERSAFIEVKGKLKRAEEQLAQCSIDIPGM